MANDTDSYVYTFRTKKIILFLKTNLGISGTTLREGCKKNQNLNLFQIGVDPPPRNLNFLTKISKKMWCPKTSSVGLRTYQNTFLC